MDQQSPRPSSALSQFDYLQALLDTALRRPGLWVVPLLAAGIIGVLVAFLGPKQWQATQTFLVREELIGRIVGPGRFESLDTMKTAQETIQEVAKRPAVVRRTLLNAGPSTSYVGSDWPTEDDIESFQGAISFSAPNGAEFGKTEVLFLTIKSSTRERAKQLAEALFDEMQIELRKVRHDRAASMQQEVQQAVDLACERLSATASQLTEIETNVGADLSELRSLNDPSSSNGELRQIYIQVQAELRGARAEVEVSRKQVEHLTVAQQDPTQLVATPRELLELQPALARLKDSLIDAQVTQSTLRGRYSDAHPAVEAATFAVADIKRQIETELSNALRGLNSQLQLATERVATLTNKADEIKSRLDELVSMRVEYGQLVDELTQRKEDLRVAQKELSQAESMRRAAEKVDLLTAMGEPQSSTRPTGPSKKTIVASALFAGTLIGIGFLMIATPASSFNMPPPPTAPQPAPRETEPGEPPSQGTTAMPSSSPAFVIPDISPTSYMQHPQNQ